MVVCDQELNKMRTRLRLAYYPFFIILFGFVLGCSVINWVMFIRPERFNFNPDLLYLYTPLILSLCAVLLWLRQIICRLSHLDGNRETILVYYLASVILITTSTYYSQVLFEDVFTKVVHLNDISDIYEHKIAKFFSVEKYFVKKSLLGYYLAIKKEHGKNHHIGLKMDMFFVFPVFSQYYRHPVVWIGVPFHGKTQDGYLDEKDLEPFRLRFIDDTFNQILTMPLDKFYYLELMSDYFINNGFNEALKNSKLKSTGREIVFLAHYEPLKDKISDDVCHFIMALMASFFIWLFIVCPPLKEERPDKMLE